MGNNQICEKIKMKKLKKYSFILFLFLSGCQYWNQIIQSNPFVQKTNNKKITRKHNEEKMYNQNYIDSLKFEIEANKIINDSLFTLTDSLFFQVDSLQNALEISNSRIAVNSEFVIPDSIVFANRMFYLKNERIREQFTTIFQQELKNAPSNIPRSGKYFALFDSIFSKTKIPLDIKYLAIAESQLNPLATSWVGASGIWQFMSKTGKGYGLKINSFIDERRNVLKSTNAAVKYLQNAHNYLLTKGSEDWLLTMCAYNAGPGSIAKVIKAQGGKDFFDIILRVDETNKYVWRSVAIKMIFENEKEIFGKEFSRELPLFTNTRTVNLTLKGHYKIDDWAQSQGTVVRKVWELNPWIKIYKRKRKKYSPINDIVLPPGNYSIILPKTSIGNKSEIVRIEKKFQKKNSGYFTQHIVKRGDTLYDIAKKYKTTVSKIKNINHLRSNTIRVGQKLKLYGQPNYKSVKKSSKTYTVKKGDSIGVIAQKLGIKSSQLVAKNNLKSKKNNGRKIIIIYPGQKLYY